MKLRSLHYVCAVLFAGAIPCAALLGGGFPLSIPTGRTALSPPKADAKFEGELLDFSATWCGPCQQMSPIVHKLEREGLPVRQVDVDRDKALARKYGVTNIPAFVLVVRGKVVDRRVGVTSESTLRSMAARIPRQTLPAAPIAPPATRIASPSRAPQRTNPGGTTTNGAIASSEGDLGLPEAFPGTVRANIDQSEPDGFDGLDIGTPTAPSASRATSPADASVRIRVTDGKGVNFGSGTIVESKPGRAILLSCGHVLRDVKPDSTIEIDVFQWSNGKITNRETYVGEVLGYDSESDVGLLSIPVQRRLPVCPIATASEPPGVGDRVLSIGCSRGELPTLQTVSVKQLNRYIGPANIECTGLPVQGRSGGGLFDEAGRVVGVCIARDERDQEGIYAGLKAIHALLEQHRFAHLYRNEDEAPVDELELRVVGNDVHAEVRAAEQVVSAVAAAADDRGETVPTSAAATATTSETAIPANVAQLLEDAGEAEVICVIRKHGEPESRSRVVIINRASSKFVTYLCGEMQDQPRLTSAHRDLATDGARRARAAAREPARESRPSMESRLKESGWQILR